MFIFTLYVGESFLIIFNQELLIRKTSGSDRDSEHLELYIYRFMLG